MDQQHGFSLRAIGAMSGFLAVVAPCGCRKPAPPPPAQTSVAAPAPLKRYHLEGVIVSKAPRSQELVVRHGAISGLMPPMTMIYKVQDAAVYAKLQPGEQIDSDVLTTGFDDKLFLEKIVVTAEPRNMHGPAPQGR